MKFRLKFLTLITFSVLLTGCMNEKKVKEHLVKALKEDPTILAEAIKANPVEILTALQQASKNAQREMAKNRENEEQKKLEASFDNPLKPEIRSDDSFRGTPNAPITLVEYSDFECPFCVRGLATVMELLKKYDGKIRFLYKHLPLSFHKNARIASQYYEAIRLQDPNKAFEFHDELFANQKQIKKGEKFLKKVAKKVGANMSKLKKTVNSKAVIARVKADEAEAQKFGMSGTPGFILNGIPVKGAYPAAHFVQIIDKLIAKGKLKL